MMTFFQQITLLIVGLFATESIFAQESKQQIAETSIEAVRDNPDYILLGEFKGTIVNADGKEQVFALQIRPIGKDRFDGVAYFGGLPGEDGYIAESIPLIGKRHDNFVVMSGSPWAIFVKQDVCIALNMDGAKVGTLHRIVRSSPTLGAKPPADGIVLFDGTSTDQFVNGQMTDDGLLMRGTEIKMLLQDFDLHLEFWLPFMPAAGGQQRGNSGIYILSRYECQILDSFAQGLQFDGCGAVYRYKSPDLNASLPPLTWQTYDLRFTAPRWASDKTKIRDARVSIWLNGIKVQDDVALPDKTGHGAIEEVVLLPTKLQDHRDPVLFRNIWVIDRGIVGPIDFPIAAQSTAAIDLSKSTSNAHSTKIKRKTAEDDVTRIENGASNEPTLNNQVDPPANPRANPK